MIDLAKELELRARLRAFDFESHIMQPGLLAPPIVCGSLADAEPGAERVMLKTEALDALEALLRSNATIAGAHLAFDFGLAAAEDPARFVRLIFAKYDREEVFDVLIGYALLAIARGHMLADPVTGKPIQKWNAKKKRLTQAKRYNLEIVTRLLLGRTDAKENDEYRLRYHELEPLPLSQWPAEAVQYPRDDVRNTWDDAAELIRQGVNLGQVTGKPFSHMTHQARAAWAMQLACIWGHRTDPAVVEEIAADIEAKHAANVERFKDSGFIDPATGKEREPAIKRAVILAYGGGAPCAECSGKGKGKVPSPKTGNPINCKPCGGSGLAVPDAVPKTDTGGVSTSRDTLAESGDDTLEAYAGVSEVEKLRDTYIPFLRQGVNVPITLDANVLVESGRASYDGLIQLLPRKGRIREAFVARRREFVKNLPPHVTDQVLCSVDYAAVELSTLAQVCLWVLGWSRLAEAINSGVEPHALFAAKMIGTTYEELRARIKAGDVVAKDARQMAKAANFGFPGFMGGAKLAITKRKEGLRFCIAAGVAPPCPKCDGMIGITTCRTCYGRGALCGLEKVTEWGKRNKRKIPPTCKTCIVIASDLRLQYLAMWEEMGDYFDWIQGLDGFRENLAVMDSPGTGYLRGGMGSNAANHPFQHLASAGAKHALYLVSREAYTDENSPLYGVRPKVFAHDEVISEGDEATAHEWGYRKAAIMVAGMREFVPDVKVSAEPAIMVRWYKDAETVHDERGRLAIWRPKKKDGGAKKLERYVQRGTA